MTTAQKERKVALVTGSSRWIGRAIALRLAQEGVDVVVNCSKSVDAAQEVANQIQSMGRRSIVIRADVTSYPEVERMMKQAAEQLGDIDILVNNAGGPMGSIKLFHKTSPDDFDNCIPVNLKGVYNCTRAVIERMMERQTGCIVNISSEWAIDGYHGGVIYAAAKAGVLGFTMCLSREVGKYGIRVNAVAPGAIPRPLTPADLETKTWRRAISELVLPTFPTPEDVAETVAFLAFQAKAITGETIVVSSGMRAIGGGHL